ncbi:MAG: flippase-like domain-containing protein [Lachnospiraceae bacterium]|nr:flippase-like domain-containing protein [Lachnospiraceae bacterium]
MNIILYILSGILALVLFIFIHLLKMMRLYLILLDEKIEFKRFIFAYFRTTFVNFIIPYKLGEIYRIFAFGRITGSFLKGFLSIVTDRFFDTLALVLVMLPMQILYKDTISAVTVALPVFLAAVVFAFMIFPSVYGYLNRYIIINRSSERSMAVLRSLEIIKTGYDKVRELISGRYSLMIIMSLGAWIFEGILLFLLSLILGIPFGAGDFCGYITSILSTGHEIVIQRQYFIFCFTGLLLMTIISFVICRLGAGPGRNNKDEA